MKTIDITEEQFKIYDKIRESGATNMFLVSEVKKIAKEEYRFNFEKEALLQIMRRYSYYKDFFKKERDKRIDELNKELMKPLRIEVKDLDLVDEQSANDITTEEDKEGGEDV